MAGTMASYSFAAGLHVSVPRKVTSIFLFIAILINDINSSGDVDESCCSDCDLCRTSAHTKHLLSWRWWLNSTASRHWLARWSLARWLVNVFNDGTLSMLIEMSKCVKMRVQLSVPSMNRSHFSWKYWGMIFLWSVSSYPRKSSQGKSSVITTNCCADNEVL